MAVDQVLTSDGKSFDVLFIGFENGQVTKTIQVKSKSGYAWEDKTIETIRISVDEAITKLEVLHDSDWDKRRLYVVSSSKLSELPLHRCGNYKTCR